MLVAQRPKARVASLDLAFKPNMDDFRESPAVEVAAALARRFGLQIDIVEPYARGLPMKIAGICARLIHLDNALAECDVLIVLISHNLFRSIPVKERADRTVYNARRPAQRRTRHCLHRTLGH
jgi:UDP-N-acetyl-D-mannosaminuronic acid dehydrogenase